MKLLKFAYVLREMVNVLINNDSRILGKIRVIHIEVEPMTHQRLVCVLYNCVED